MSDPKDSHVLPVTEELSRRGVAFEVFDPASYPNGSTVTITSCGAGVDVYLHCDTHLDLANVRSVWYRRPGSFAISDQLKPEEAEWLRAECSHAIRTVWDEIPALWVSHPDAIRRASVKVKQLDTALKLGFSIPRFTITNDEEDASDFISSCPSGVVVKSLNSPVITYRDQVCTLYTHLLTADDREELNSVRFGPTYLQEFVKKSMDVRVTVFDDEVFAVGIKSTSSEDALIDFRRAEIYDLPHEVINIPEDLKQLCVQLVQRLNLKFGAIDLLLKPNGDYLFLEVNPNGQWYWLEWVTGLPMVRSLCNLLMSAK
ncbi:hypothetical protein KBP30_23510 [Streptomyces sp. Go40/10]|uniref:MvdC/MvdD family ATP grasp protein n=1 Tax=Streptomyces sp. Go40/10 TaxID=2825844 RepID=UPI001E3A78CE|nr:hypothetical protein [Streptomyces sp. Go40/10]UFR03956.1 hypothetical protein KBP30_23510 [Streptomyces sp. Go40/10]